MKQEPDLSRFDTISYLSCGTDMQRAIYSILVKSNIFSVLKDFSPLLAGTYPIGINIVGSDLDIICEVYNKENFINVLTENFSEMKDFRLSLFNNKETETVIANFLIAETEFEIFGQNKPVKMQNAYIHMINEYKVLCRYGNGFREEIIKLKKSGLKTEPAFALLLGLKGDPYEAMLYVE